jgi:hypothetical protein
MQRSVTARLRFRPVDFRFRVGVVEITLQVTDDSVMVVRKSHPDKNPSDWDIGRFARIENS